MTLSVSEVILLVEDHPVDQRAVQRLLQQMAPPPKEILVASSAAEARAILEQRSDVDCALVDYLLGPETGLDFLKWLQEQNRHLAVVALTGAGNEKVAVELMKQGAGDYLVKDELGPELLQRTIQSSLHKVSLEMEVARKQQELEAMAQQLREANTRLETLSQTDELTQVQNRRHFNEQIDLECRRARRSGPLSLLLLDVDCFKAFNDTYGHLEGDECLRKVAQVVRGCVHRSTDSVSRYGGEEFAVLLPATSKEGSLERAKAIRQQVEELKIPHSASPVADYVTVSLGVATTHVQHATARDLIKSADDALYQAKKNGRNCVMHIDDVAE